jgi:hypothetical protein
MAEPITFAALVVAAISPLYQILKRHYDVKSADLEWRINLARELKDACEQWSSLLELTFDKSVELLNEKGPAAARREIERQQNNFNALDYGSLASDSAALRGLREDRRFEAFADVCERFYNGAIEVKRIAYEKFDEAGRSRTFKKDGFTAVARLWKGEIEQLLDRVRWEYRVVESIKRA